MTTVEQFLDEQRRQMEVNTLARMASQALFDLRERYGEDAVVQKIIESEAEAIGMKLEEA